ncbi:MAG: carbon starvation protein A [Alphaproteobacteria bacterium]|nr:carbon starvation protein A [Alphaproteobacteria bacterium]
MKKIMLWCFVAVLGAASLGGIALIRGERISALWFLTACICTQLIAYRFYSSFIAAKILCLDGKRLTPAKRINDGKDFVPTNRWIVFGHHFAAIAGPGPLIGPTLAAQFGYLPGVLWILIGCVLAGAVQDMVILFSSLRRNGKSLGQMIKDEISDVAGYAALIGTLAIIIILISVLALVVVKALMHSPWGSFTVLMTIPIAMLIGYYLYYIRPGGVLEASLAGIVLFLLAVYGGKFVHYDPSLAPLFDHSAKFLAFAIMIYGFAAATLPVWLLLAPRDYLSSFLKLGTITLLAIALFIFRPQIQMPALTQFVDGSGPIFSGKIFPFLFITIACGAISGFHALVASGTTPKIISDERDVRLVGYGSMLLEGCVAIMALIAACVLDPGIFFAINSPTEVAAFPVAAEVMQNLATQMGENTLYARTGGAPSLAVGMANIFSSAFGSQTLSLWYHFAIMFEAIFILTTLDAGTRVARFMLEDLLAQIKIPRCLTLKCQTPFHLWTSFLVVAGWGYFLYVGVVDPKGGVNLLWPLFGVSNQMLAGIALTLATVIIYKNKGWKSCLITALPLLFVLTVTSTAVIEKVFSSNTKLAFNNHLISGLALSFLAIFWIVVVEGVKKITAEKQRKS